MKQYLARVCWNTSGWEFPSGDARNFERKSHVKRYGFGHEEWLFNLTWKIDGWHYSFLQPVNASFRNQKGKTLDLLLYTHPPRPIGRSYVARISECQILTIEESEYALKEYRQRGWLEQMIEDVDAIKGNSNILKNIDQPHNVINIKYKIDDLLRYDEKQPVNEDDYLCKLNRYRLVEIKNEIKEKIVPESEGTHKLRPTNIKEFFVSGRRSSNPNHNRLQNRLFELLSEKYGDQHVHMEVRGVDIRVNHPDLYAFLEVKSVGDPRLAIRDAIGQLLEYAYLKKWNETITPKLCIAAPGKPNDTIYQYLKLIRDQFNINIEYIVVSEDQKDSPL